MILFGVVCFQFEDHMLTICMKILDLNHKHTEDPAADVAARADATYVSRVISAMVNLSHCPRWTHRTGNKDVRITADLFPDQQRRRSWRPAGSLGAPLLGREVTFSLERQPRYPAEVAPSG